MKRIVAILIVAAMVAGLLLTAGCGPKKGPGVIAPGPFGKYSPSIEITYSKILHTDYLNIIQSIDTSYTEEDNMWTRAYEEELGIKLKLAFGGQDPSAYIQQLTATILMGDIPDIMNVLEKDFAYNTLRSLYDEEMLADLTDLYDEYASDDLKRYIDTAGHDILKPITFNGRLMGLPQIIGAENEAWAFWWIRKDWLETLSLDMPTTLDELMDVAARFTEEDPDGDGEKNTIGMAIGDEILTVCGMFFNGYGSYPKTWLKDTDGKLFYGTLAAETKTALSKLKDLVAAGYATNPENYYYQLMYNDAVAGKVGIIPGKIHFGLSLKEAYKKNDQADFVAIAALNATDKPLKVTAPFNAAMYYAISAKCSNPEAAIKILNLFVKYREDPSVETYQTYIDNDKGQAIWPVAMIPAEIPGKNLAQAKAFAEHYKNGTVPERGNDKTVYTYVMKWIQDKDPEFWGWNAIYGLDGSEHLAEYFFENDIFQFSQFNAAPTDSMKLYMEQLLVLENTMAAEIVSGVQPLDYFDAFASQWLNSGGREITDEVNEWAANYKDPLAKE